MQKTHRKAASSRAVVIVLTLALILGLLGGLPAQAKTIASENGNTLFFYALNAQGKSVLLKVIPLEDLKALSHGQLSDVTSGEDTGVNYTVSSTDNYPTTQYCEARGFTLPELVDYVKSVSGVSGVSELSFTGDDTLRFMATDSYGNYSRAWTYDELYGVSRYYFEGLYSAETGWNTGWEVAGDDSSKFGISQDTYNSTYKDSDPYYADKRAVFETGVQTVPILATESLSGRTTSSTLVASTELGISNDIDANDGVVAGCLENELEDTWSLRLCIPMSEADLMAAHRTAYDNFKWVYNMQLDMTNAPALVSKGTVAQPEASFKKSADGNTLTISLSCETAGASLYYSFDGAPQILYTGPITYDVTGRDLSSNPVIFYMTAVKEGYDDAEIIMAKYPGMAPAFTTLYSGMTGSDVTFTAAEGVSAADWKAWTGALTFISIKTPSVSGYVTVSRDNYAIDNTAKTITFDKSLFTDTGSYSVIFHAAQYANKALSLTMKKTAPAVNAAESYAFKGDITLTFADKDYQAGMSVYVTPSGGESSLISSSYLDRTVSGQATIKSAYFELTSCPVTGAGDYTLTLVNSRYQPGSQDVGIVIRDSTGFNDVPPDAWYANAINFVTGEGLFSGTGADTFSPDAAMTRGMFITVLWRLAGSPKTESTSLFADVSADAWYCGAAAWASENGIVSGTGGGMFSPDLNITREQAAVILYRYASFSENDVSVSDETALSAFTDASMVSDWARAALGWSVEKGLINGTDGKLNPSGSATRAQAAKILMCFSERAG